MFVSSMGSSAARATELIRMMAMMKPSKAGLVTNSWILMRAAPSWSRMKQQLWGTMGRGPTLMSGSSGGGGGGLGATGSGISISSSSAGPVGFGSSFFSSSSLPPFFSSLILSCVFVYL